MTAVDATPRRRGRTPVSLGSNGLVAIVSLCIAVTALGIDTILLVPAIGPTLSAGILAVGPWQVSWMCAIAAVVVAFLVVRLPGTLPPPVRRPIAGRTP